MAKLDFQQRLKEQVLWIIEKKMAPPELEGIVRDLWALLLKGSQASHKHSKLTHTSDKFPARNSLILIHLGLFVLRKTEITLGDLLRYVLVVSFIF